MSGKPRTVWLVTALVLAIFAGFSATFQADGVRQSDLVLGQSQARDGQNVLAEHFPGGSGSPANVIVPAAEQDTAVAALDGLDGVSSIAAIAQESPAGTVPVGASAESVPPVLPLLLPPRWTAESCSR